jgi:BASS family bile acid:Na+ symporter
MYVAVPVVATALALMFHLTPAVRIALLAMAVSPVPPILPDKQRGLGARVEYVYGLLVAASVAAVALVPFAITVVGRLFQRDVDLVVAGVAKTIGVTVLVPLLAGLAVRHRGPGLAARVAPWVSRVANILLLVGCLPLLVIAGPGMVSFVGNGAILAIAAVVAAGLAAGHWLGGPNPDDRTALAIAASMRHPGVALVIAHGNLPEEPLVSAAVLLFFLVSFIATLPYGAWRKRAHAARAGRAGEAP